MRKKEFTEEELYEQMKYIVYCLETEKEVKSCDSYFMYQSFLKKADKHRGDCTQDPASCARCFSVTLEIEAQNIVDNLMSADVGYCGKKCVEECNFGEEKNQNIEEIEEDI